MIMTNRPGGSAMSAPPSSIAEPGVARVARALAAAGVVAGCAMPVQPPTSDGGKGRASGKAPMGTLASPSPTATPGGPSGIASVTPGPLAVATTAPAFAPLAALAGVVRVPAELLSDQGTGLVSNNGGSLISDQGTGLASRAAYALRATVEERPYAGATVRLQDAKGHDLATATTDAEGRYRFDGDLPRQNLVLHVDLPAGAGAMRGVAARKAAEVKAVDVDLVSTLATTYILDRYVATQAIDAQTTLDKLPPEVEAETRRVTGEALSAGSVAAFPALTPIAIVTAIEALRKAAPALDAQLELVKRLLVVGAISAAITDGPALEAQLFQPTDVLLTPSGDLVIADWLNRLVRVVTPAGMIGTLAGTGETGMADGPGAAATFTNPVRLGMDAAGTLYVADQGPVGPAVRTIAPDGMVKTLPIAVKGAFAVAPDGTIVMADGDDGKTLVRVKPGGTPEPFAAGFAAVMDLRFAPDGAVWVADNLYEGGLKRVTPAGAVAVLPTDARVGFPEQLAFGPDGALYVVHDSRHLVKRAADGAISEVLTWSNAADDGTRPGPCFMFVGGIEVDPTGHVYLADNGNNRIRKIAPDGTYTTVAGNGKRRAQDGEGQQVLFNEPVSLAADATGNVFIADKANNRIRKLALDGAVTTYAGSGAWGSADGPAANATFSGPAGVAVGSDGAVYVTETGRIRKIALDGTVSLFAGGSKRTIDGEPSSAFHMLEGLCAAATGDLVVTEKANYGPVWRVSPTGVITTLAKGALMDDTSDVVADAAGNFYVALRYRNRIRKIAPDGTSSDFVGGAGIGSADGQGAAATFASPAGLGIDAEGNLYVADVGNDAIRKVTPAGVVTTLAIEGLKMPEDVAVLPDGRLVVADTGHNQVKVLPKP